MDVQYDELLRQALLLQATATATATATRDGCSVFQDQVCAPPHAHKRFFVSMGRPLWTARASASSMESFDGLIDLAAQALLAGSDPSRLSNFTDETLNGAASMLCRLGVRPLSSSPSAARVVADFMAVLSYVSSSKEQFLSTYASEPLLTFGAARVWYTAAQGRADAYYVLHERILPWFRTLVSSDVLDTGGDMGGLVARIVMLLAMDTVTGFSIENTRQYTGTFHDVCDFLLVLCGGDACDVQDRSGTSLGNRVSVADVYDDQWRGWKIGFSHFVQLAEEPNEECLWAMLARRAAGVCPRECEGVDLVIPIFVEGNAAKGTLPRVSMVLLHVVNRHGGKDPAFPASATTAMRPSVVFQGESAKNLTTHQVIRVYLALSAGQEPRTAGSAAKQRFFLRNDGEIESKHATTAAADSYVLCLQGLAPSHVRSRRNGASMVFLSKEIVRELALLCGLQQTTACTVIDSLVHGKAASVGLKNALAKHLRSVEAGGKTETKKPKTRK